MCAWRGEWDVAKAAARLDPRQVDYWEVFDEHVEPIGLRELLLLVAQAIQHIAAGHQQELKLTELCPWLETNPPLTPDP